MPAKPWGRGLWHLFNVFMSIHATGPKTSGGFAQDLFRWGLPCSRQCSAQGGLVFILVCVRQCGQQPLTCSIAM